MRSIDPYLAIVFACLIVMASIAYRASEREAQLQTLDGPLSAVASTGNHMIQLEPGVTLDLDQGVITIRDWREQV